MNKDIPNFDEALQAHLDSIRNRDIAAFKSHLTSSETLYTIIQNGHAFTSPQELVTIHEEWFKDSNWTWEGEVVHKVVGSDMAMALIKYDYKVNKEVEPFSTWLVYVFRLEDGNWRIIHDHNTAVDFYAFAKAAGQSA